MAPSARGAGRRLRREGELGDAGAACRVHDVDDALVRGVRVRRDDQDHLARAAGRGGQLGRQCLDAAPVDRLLVDRIAAVRGDGDDDLVRPVARLVGVGDGQADLQLGELRVRRRQHQEDQDDEQHVDERDQVDLRLLAPLPAEVERHSVSRRAAPRIASGAARGDPTPAPSPACSHRRGRGSSDRTSAPGSRS